MRLRMDTFPHVGGKDCYVLQGLEIKILKKKFKGENFMNTREGLHIGF